MRYCQPLGVMLGSRLAIANKHGGIKYYLQGFLRSEAELGVRDTGSVIILRRGLSVFDHRAGT